MKRELLLRSMLTFAPFYMLWTVLDARLRTHETRLCNLRSEVIRTQAALIQHSGDQVHLAPHPSPN